jgi:DNA-binding transcriptional ArsR family regulator
VKKTPHGMVRAKPPTGNGPASPANLHSANKQTSTTDRHLHSANKRTSATGTKRTDPNRKNKTRTGPNGSDMTPTKNDLDPVWKALSDPTRRAILDLLRDQPRMTTEIVDTFPHLTRFGVMKHLEALREAGLVNTREEGRQRWNSLNVFPIRQIYERWVSPFQELWAGQLLGIKNLAEEAMAEDARAEKRPQAKPRSPRKKTKDQNSSSSST